MRAHPPTPDMQTREKRYKRLVQDWAEVGEAFFSGPMYGSPDVQLDKELAAGRDARVGHALDALYRLHKREYAFGALALRSGEYAASAVWFRRSLATGVCYIAAQESLFSDLGRTYSDWGVLRGGDLCARMMLISSAGGLTPLAKWSAAYVNTVLAAGGSVVSDRVHDRFFGWFATAIVSDSLSGSLSGGDEEAARLMGALDDRTAWRDALDHYCDVRVSRALHYKRPTDKRPAAHTKDGVLQWIELFPDNLFPIELFALVGLSSRSSMARLVLEGEHPLLREFGSTFPDLVASELASKGYAGVDFDERLNRVIELAPLWFESEFSIGRPPRASVTPTS